LPYAGYVAPLGLAGAGLPDVYFGF
jgi:hypothetical protein